MISLNEKHVVIFGGGAGIGFATAKQASAQGAKVTIVGRNEATLKERTNSLGANASYIVADFGNSDDLDRMLESITAIDHLVLSASSSVAFGSFDDVSEQALDNAFRNKFYGYWLATQKLHHKIQPNGSIVMVTGAAHRASIPGMAAVAAVNGAIASFAQVLAVELAPTRVNIVSPGMVKTHAYNGMPEEMRSQVFAETAKNLPAGVVGEADEIANLIVTTLVSPFMTGALIDVDGGTHLAKG